MRAIRLEGLRTLAIREVEKPVPRPNELLVKVAACGICGTDRHLFLGEFPSTPPVTLGHEFAAARSKPSAPRSPRSCRACG